MVNEIAHKNFLMVKEIRCPLCGKGLIPLEGYGDIEKELHFWCDDCNIDITIEDNYEDAKLTDYLNTIYDEFLKDIEYDEEDYAITVSFKSSDETKKPIIVSFGCKIKDILHSIRACYYLQNINCDEYKVDDIIRISIKEVKEQLGNE